MPDSQHILVLSEATGRTASQTQPHNSLGIYHWPSGRIRWLVDDAERSIEGAWASPDGSIIVDEVRNAGHAPGFIDPPPGGWEMAESGNGPASISIPRHTGNLIPLGTGSRWRLDRHVLLQ